MAGLFNNFNAVILSLLAIAAVLTAYYLTRKRNKMNTFSTPILNRFSRDLTQEARQNKLDILIGRDDEIKRVIQILSRRRKNNVILLGDAGTGKTAARYQQ